MIASNLQPLTIESAGLAVDFDAFASIPSGAPSRRLFIDAECLDRHQWALVIRGEDYHVIGRSVCHRIPALVHNEIDGAYVRYVLAATGERRQVERAAEALFQLYRGPGSIGARLKALPPDLMPLAAALLAAFPVGFYSRPDGKAHRTQRYAGTRAARAAELQNH